jgi:hypothetical protein
MREPFMVQVTCLQACTAWHFDIARRPQRTCNAVWDVSAEVGQIILCCLALADASISSSRSSTTAAATSPLQHVAEHLQILGCVSS